MREQHPRVEEHPVAELADAREERLGSDLAVQEAKNRSRLTRAVATGGLHAAFFGEHPDPTGCLRLEVRPHGRADTTGDDELALRSRHQAHERVDALTELDV